MNTPLVKTRKPSRQNFSLGMDMLRESEERATAVFDHAAVAMSVTGLDGEWIDFNRFYPKMFGYTKAELKKTNFKSITYPDDRAADEVNMARLLNGSLKEYAREKRYIHKNGSIVHAAVHATVVRNKDGQPQYIIAVLYDITQRKKAEERQDFLEKISDTLFTSFEDNLTIKKVAQLILSYIADYCRVVTLDEENNISDISVNHTDPSRVQLAVDLYDQYKDDIDSNQGVHKILKTGKAEMVPVIDQRIFDSIKNNPKLVKIAKDIGLKSYMGIPLIVHGKTIGAITFSSVAPGRIYNKEDLAFVKEVGRRIALALDNARLYREAEKSRLHAENQRQHLYDLFMQAPAAIGVTRGKYHVFEFTNPLYTKLVGRNDSFIGKSVRQVFPELASQGYFELLDQVYQTGEAFVGSEMPLKLGSKDSGKLVDRFVNFVYQPFKDHQGRVQGIMAHAVDVTEQVLGKQKLLESEERFTLAQQAANIGTFDWQIKTGHFLCTRQLEILYGLPRKGFANKYSNWLKTIYVGDRSRVKAEMSAAVNGKHLDSELRIVRPDGSMKWIAIRGRVFYDKQGKPERLLGINRNITKRKQAEEALRESEEQFRSLADSMPQIVWTARPDGYVDYYNKQWYEYTGFKEGYGDLSWRPILHPEDVKPCIDGWNNSVKTGKPYQIEYRFKDRRKPGTYRWFLGKALPVKDKKGSIIKWFGTCTDIDDVRRTIARKNELEKITVALKAQQAQLVVINKAQDEFISLASHQLRTPATGVKQYVGMALEGYAGKLNTQQTAFLKQAYESNERQINIVNDLLRVAKIDAGKVVLDKKKTDLVGLVGNVIHEQNSKFADKQQKVVFTHTANTLQAIVDPHRLRMVIENIIDNASKYTPAERTLEITTSKLNNWICIAVKDQGVGVRKTDAGKIFDKFSRIDNPLSISVGGTGLGLYWAKKIMDLHNGEIEVDSKLGHGSTFIIKIPLTKS